MDKAWNTRLQDEVDAELAASETIVAAATAGLAALAEELKHIADAKADAGNPPTA